MSNFHDSAYAVDRIFSDDNWNLIIAIGEHDGKKAVGLRHVESDKEDIWETPALWFVMNNREEVAKVAATLDHLAKVWDHSSAETNKALLEESRRLRMERYRPLA